MCCKVASRTTGVLVQPPQLKIDHNLGTGSDLWVRYFFFLFQLHIKNQSSHQVKLVSCQAPVLNELSVSTGAWHETKVKPTLNRSTIVNND